MARSDFDIQPPAFISTRENITNHIFDVDTQPNVIGIDSQLQVSVTASKDGNDDLIANSTSETNPPVTIVPEQDTGGFVDGACCVCQPNGQVICTENVTEEDCLAQGGVWKANTDCTVAACADVECEGDDDDTEPSDGNFRLDTPFNGLDRMIIDARFALGEESAILVLSGTGTEGEIVELQDNTTGNWNPVAAVDANGFWKTNDTDPTSDFYEAATVTIDRSYDLSGDWYKVRVRYQSDPTGVLESENTFLPGFVFMSISQSERAQMFVPAKDNWPLDVFPIENNHNFQLLQHPGSNTTWFTRLENVQPDGKGGITGDIILDANGEFRVATNADEGSGAIYFAKIPKRYRISLEPGSEDPDDLGLRTNRNSSTKFTTTLKHMANMFNETMPNIPVLFVDNQWSGSSRKTLMVPQINNLSRDFRFTSTCVDWCRRHGTEIGVVDDMWYASDMFAGRFDIRYGPLYNHTGIEFSSESPDGINIIGVTYDYEHGDVYAYSGGSNPKTDLSWASFFDARTGVEAHELGEGIFRKDRTRWAIMSTNLFPRSIIKAGKATSALGFWGSGSANVEVMADKSPQYTTKNTWDEYGIISGVQDVDADGNPLPTASTGSIDFNVVNSRSGARSAHFTRRNVSNLVNQEHNYFMLMSFDPTVVCHGEMGADGIGDGIVDTWADDSHPCGNNVERRAFPEEFNLPGPPEYDMDHPDAAISNDFGRAIDGQIKFNEYTVLSAARTAGEVDIPIPIFELESIAETEAVFRVKDYNGNALPQGSKVETLFSLRNELDDNGNVIDLTNSSWFRDTEEILGEGKGLDHPNYKKILGFELDQGDGYSWDVGFQTEFGDDDLSVKVIPDVPFKNGDEIRFNSGGSDSYHLWSSDCMHRIYRAMPILNIPGISAEGIPISAEFRTPVVTVSGL